MSYQESPYKDIYSHGKFFLMLDIKKKKKSNLYYNNKTLESSLDVILISW